MLILSIFSILLSISVTTRKDVSLLLSRAALNSMVCVILIFIEITDNTLYSELFNSPNISQIFSNVFNIQIFRTFIYGIISVILLTSLLPRKYISSPVSNNENLSFTMPKNGIYNSILKKNENNDKSEKFILNTIRSDFSTLCRETKIMFYMILVHIFILICFLSLHNIYIFSFLLLRILYTFYKFVSKTLYIIHWKKEDITFKKSFNKFVYNDMLITLFWGIFIWILINSTFLGVLLASSIFYIGENMYKLLIFHSMDLYKYIAKSLYYIKWLDIKYPFMCLHEYILKTLNYLRGLFTKFPLLNKYINKLSEYIKTLKDKVLVMHMNGDPNAADNAPVPTSRTVPASGSWWGDQVSLLWKDVWNNVPLTLNRIDNFNFDTCDTDAYNKKAIMYRMLQYSENNGAPWGRCYHKSGKRVLASWLQEVDMQAYRNYTTNDGVGFHSNHNLFLRLEANFLAEVH